MLHYTAGSVESFQIGVNSSSSQLVERVTGLEPAASSLGSLSLYH